MPTAASRSPNFVTFHVDVSTESSADLVHPNMNLQHNEYLSMIDLMFQSARLFHQDATFTILTNSEAKFTNISEPFVRIDSEVRPDHIMLDRMRAQMQFAQDYVISRNPLSCWTPTSSSTDGWIRCLHKISILA